MAAGTYLGDRRAGPRFHIAGQLWTSLDVRTEAIVRNLSVGGALVEARLVPELRWIRSAVLGLPGVSELTVRVRHVTPIAGPPADDRCLLGVEFLAVSAADRRRIEALMQRTAT